MAARPEIHAAAGRPSTMRLIAGAAILSLWPLSKIILPVFIVASTYSAGTKALLIGLLFVVVPKFCVISTVLVMGRSGFVWLKSRILARLSSILPPQLVGRPRYRIGLVMFIMPFAIEWSFPYTSHVPDGVLELVDALSWVADLMLVASLFVLGGAFWNKLRALFIRTALADFSEAQEATSAPVDREERWRLIAGCAFILIGAFGLASTPLIGTSALSSDWQSQVYGWTTIGPIVMFVVAALILRRSRTTRLIAMIVRGLPQTVGRMRHIVGLVMLVAPIIFGFSVPHLANAISGYAPNGIFFGLVGTAMFLASFFVLGGGFCGKFRALFVQGATIRYA
ncbi:MAG: hypothetical protein AAFX92_09440 [Pseudomonadota bacterium]